ncbi:MAG: hypothetical protein ACUVXA_07095 [Candidatus Jordarchaeum sp.]|uniref:hypothetical protein n=1 Tax=Candidatus Jordarchaeum sp. TaxID=2823881 RepID=UPI004049FA36
MADEFSELLDGFGDDKKIKELAEIISGVVKIMLNAVDMLEGRMNELDNRLNGLERNMNRLGESRFGGSSESMEGRRKAPAGPEDEEYGYRSSAREPPPYSHPTPAPAYGSLKAPATASGPAPIGGPVSARMQLQGELKDLFSRMRQRRG